MEETDVNSKIPWYLESNSQKENALVASVREQRVKCGLLHGTPMYIMYGTMPGNIVNMNAVSFARLGWSDTKKKKIKSDNIKSTDLEVF
jgi:hypothetical protein